MSNSPSWPVMLWSWFTVLGGVLLGGSEAGAASNAQPPAQVYVIAGSTGGFANVLLYLDGKNVEKLTSNSHVVLSIVPGPHEISSAGTTRVALSLNATAGGTYYVKLTIQPNGLPQLASLSDQEGEQLVAQTRPVREQALATYSTAAAPKNGTKPAAPKNGTTRTAQTEPDTTEPKTSGFYVGIGGGLARAAGFSGAVDESVLILQDAVDFVFGPGVFSTTGSGDDSDVGAKLFFGYAVNRYVAFEGFYASLGEFKINASATNGMATFSTVDRWRPSGFGLAGLGLFPIGDSFALFGKLGFTYWTMRYDSVLSDTVTSTTVTSEKESGGSPLVGVGAKWDFSRHFGLRFEYERTFDVGNKDTTGQFDIDLISVSGVVRF